MTLLPSRRRFDWRTRAELAAALAAVEQQRDRAIGKARAQRDQLAAAVERHAATHDQSAAWAAHLEITMLEGHTAEGHRLIAEEYRAFAGEIDDGLPPVGRPLPGRAEGSR